MSSEQNFPKERKLYRPATELVYVKSVNIDEDTIEDPYNASSVPIYQTATFKQTSSSGAGRFDYTRSGNPTRSACEAHLAKIMAAKDAFVVTSGMTALDVILRLVKAGDEIVAGNDLYGGTNRLLAYLQDHMDIKTHNVDTTSVDAVTEKLCPNKTKMVLLETPTNPKIKIADIKSISEVVRKLAPNAIIVVDNTMMSPYLQKTLSLGAHIEYHSGTKYLSGHHDLMAGVIGVNCSELASKIYHVINATGVGLSPFDSWLLLRGVKTLAVRIEKQQDNAIKVAQFLHNNGLTVHYPGLPSFPQYSLHKSLSSGPGAVLSFETGDVGISERIVESTKIWAISVSFGCVNSLISMPCRMSHASIPAEVRKQRDLKEDLIRLCVGIEDPIDLIEDLASALTFAGYSVKI
ncbi:Cystathionine beta-lyase [Smittium culicis]|uniref:Cystathionine beta-lyase n=2 Tax=Smittium culicis TaxID=133412 RepID=A0A1R1XVD9_9FUNG|nr:Cystathionine beta-lyase [Smittium culicis]